MNIPESRVHISLASQGEEQAAGRQEVAVANLQKRCNGCGENHADEQARMEGALERHCGCERFMNDGGPGCDESHQADDYHVKRRPRCQGEDNGAEESPATELRVDGTALTMTMRTPGDDLQLAAGFLVSEAVIRSPADIAEIKLCDRAAATPTITAWATSPT